MRHGTAVIRCVVDGHSLSSWKTKYFSCSTPAMCSRRAAGAIRAACLLSVYFAPELLAQRVRRRCAPADREQLERVLARTARCVCSSTCATATAPSASVHALRRAPHLRRSRRSALVRGADELPPAAPAGARGLAGRAPSATMTHMKAWKRREMFTASRARHGSDPFVLRPSAHDRRARRSGSLVALSHDARVQGRARHQPVRVSAAPADANGRAPAVLDGICLSRKSRSASASTTAAR